MTFVLPNYCELQNNVYLCDVIINQRRRAISETIMKQITFTSSKSENPQSLFVIQYTMHADIAEIFKSSSEQEAREAYEKEMSLLKGTEPADVREWPDHDQAWSDVYQIELVKCTMDEEGEVEDIETLEISDYYYL